MTENHTLEQRVATLEADVAWLKRERHDQNDSGQGWARRISGSFKDFPDFDEFVRLGKLAREQAGGGE